ncbi:MAG: antitoxin VapB family protein [Euryarchaeota archaeon]|nr:antitoxin VapB family protein [Euryarchaeota archaeon]
MAKTISVSNGVYDLLVKAKLSKESFSEVIVRSLEKRMKLTDIAGSRTISKEEWRRVSKAFEKQKRSR